MRPRLYRPLLLLGLLTLFFLGLHHQPYYPRTWVDEGFALQGALNLARHGQYAMQSAEGLRVLDAPLLANGPGVALPISGVFRLAGIGLFQGRLVVVYFLLIAAAAFFVVAQRLFGRTAAFWSSFLLVAAPEGSLLLYGRQALGIVPALAYFLLGYALWLQALERDRGRLALAAGLLMGLAAVTKGQYYLLLPTWLILLALDRLYLHQIGARKISLALAGLVGCLVAWYLAQIAIVGVGAAESHFAAARSSLAVSMVALEPGRIPGSLRNLLQSGVWLLVLPGLAYALLRRQPSKKVSQAAFLAALILIWLPWYAFISIGYPRYAYESFAIGALFSGALLAACWRWLGTGRHPEHAYRLGSVGRLLAGFYPVAILAVAGWGLVSQITAIAAPPDRSPQEFARHLAATVRPGEVVGSWEWELDALADLTYHHPPNVWVDRKTEEVQFGRPQVDSYDPFAFKPRYLIDGPFSKLTSLYAAELAAGCCRLVHSAGGYDLYEVVALSS